jgi:hypothetical protein
MTSECRLPASVGRRAILRLADGAFYFAVSCMLCELLLQDTTRKQTELVPGLLRSQMWPQQRVFLP